MKLPFLNARKARRSGSTSGEPKVPLLQRKRSAPALGGHKHAYEPLPEDWKANVAAQKSKRQSVADFFQLMGNEGKSNDTTKYRASTFLHPPESQTHHVPKPDLQPIESDHKLTKRVSENPEQTRTSQTLAAQTKVRVESCSRSRPEALSKSHLLTKDEIQQMFEGAPHFEVSRTSTGYLPRVHLVGQQPSLCDSADNSTLGNHVLSEGGFFGRDGGTGHRLGTWLESCVTVREVPSLYKSIDADPGTTSFEDFLQLPLADDAQKSGSPMDFHKRRCLFTRPEQLGLRPFDTASLVGRVSELAVSYTTRNGTESKPLGNAPHDILDMGQELFSSLLHDEEDSQLDRASFRAQIDALQRVLNTPCLWQDFSVLEARTRVGYMLCSGSSAFTNGCDQAIEPSEQVVLLLQIVIAAELLVRLNIVKALSIGSGTTCSYLTESDLNTIETERTPKVTWDLVLAERFLSNVEVSLTSQGDNVNGISTLGTAPVLSPRGSPSFCVQPKNRARQTAGLLHFAQALGWPDLKVVEDALRTDEIVGARRVSEAESIYLTPPQSPEPSHRSNDEDYFDQVQYSKKHGPVENILVRRDTAQSMIQQQPAPPESPDLLATKENWMAQTWLNGLVLSEDVAGLCLMGSLVEHTPHTRQLLGCQPDLRYGLNYGGRSFWSRSTVVSRVLAATKGAGESLGWVSSIGSQFDGLITATYQETPKSISLPRVFQSDAVSKDSAPIGSGNRMCMRRNDFTTPSDGLPVMGNEVRFEQSHLASTSASPGPQVMVCTFASPLNTKLAKLEVPLVYDVHFVSSYPCHPIPRSSGLLMPTPLSDRPERQQVLMSDAAIARAAYAQLPSFDFEDRPKDPPIVPQRPRQEQRPRDSTHVVRSVSPVQHTPWHLPIEEMSTPPAHPLHNDYEFEIIPVASLLSLPSESDRQMQQLHVGEAPPPVHAARGSIKAVMAILDCRGTEDLQLLARAWCAKVGEHALISKIGRTCLACSVREARALGMGVIIRIL